MSPSHCPVSPSSKPNRRTVRRKNLLELILSLLSPGQVRKLRARYAEGRSTIAELSRQSQCPPVLLYCILTPLWSKTPIKLRLLRIEKSVMLLKSQGLSEHKIAAQLKLPLAVVREHGSRRFSEQVMAERSWYHLRAPRPKDPNVLEYEESTLPPTTRLGWQDGALMDIPAAVKGRCPTCGHLVAIPCLACRVRADMANRTILPAGEYEETEDEEEMEPDLLFR